MGFRIKSKSRSKTSQEAGWQAVVDRVDAFIQNRPEDQLASMLAELREIDITRRSPARTYGRREHFKPLTTAVMQGLSDPEDMGFYCPVVSNGYYGLGHISPVRYIMEAVRPDTTAIAELGSGWSCNLFQTYAGIGRTRSRNLTYIGAEYTDAGRACARKIADFDTVIRYEDHHMDYRNPDISFLERFKGHVVVFTKHSIEQVDKINPRLYEDLAALDAEVTLIHFEPVGWQRDKIIMKARLQNDEDFFTRAGEAFQHSFRTEQDQLRNSAWWSWRADYNYNLTQIVDDFEARGQVEVIRRCYDFTGITNILNPTTLYHMEFIKGAEITS